MIGLIPTGKLASMRFQTFMLKHDDNEDFSSKGNRNYGIAHNAVFEKLLISKNGRVVGRHWLIRKATYLTQENVLGKNQARACG